MSTVRIGNLPVDAVLADDDYFLVDGASNGTRIANVYTVADALATASTISLKRAASYDESSSISDTDYIVVDNVTAPVRVSASNAATSLGQLATYPTGTGVAETEYILKIGSNGKPQKVDASEAAAALAELAGQVAGAELLEQAIASGIVNQAMTNAITATVPQAAAQLKAELTESESAVEIFDAGLVVSERVKNDCLTSDSGYVLDARQGKALQDGKIDKTSIADNLTTNDATKVLSAKQGKALQDGKIDKTSIVDNLTTNDATKVLSAKQGKALQDGKIDKTSIADNLTTNDATKVLSAKQGKVLQDRLSVATTEYLPTYVTNDYYSTTAVNRIRLFRTGPRSGIVRINLANDLAAIPSSDNSEHEIATFSGVSFERDIFAILPSQNAGTYASTLYLNCTSNKIVIANYSGVNIVKNTFFRIVMPVILNLDTGA